MRQIIIKSYSSIFILQYFFSAISDQDKHDQNCDNYSLYRIFIEPITRHGDILQDAIVRQVQVDLGLGNVSGSRISGQDGVSVLT